MQSKQLKSPVGSLNATEYSEVARTHYNWYYSTGKAKKWNHNKKIGGLQSYQIESSDYIPKWKSRATEGREALGNTSKLILLNSLEPMVNEGKARRGGRWRFTGHVPDVLSASNGTGYKKPPSGPMMIFAGRLAKTLLVNFLNVYWRYLSSSRASAVMQH